MSGAGFREGMRTYKKRVWGVSVEKQGGSGKRTGFTKSANVGVQRPAQENACSRIMCSRAHAARRQAGKSVPCPALLSSGHPAIARQRGTDPSCCIT